MSNPIALVTGASNGIGADLAREAAADGHDLILVARTEEALKALAAEVKKEHGVEATVVPLDLSKPGAAADLFAKVEAKKQTVDLLINNAGFGDGSNGSISAHSACLRSLA